MVQNGLKINGQVLNHSFDNKAKGNK